LKWNTHNGQEEGSDGRGTLQGREITAVRHCEDIVIVKTLEEEGGDCCGPPEIVHEQITGKKTCLLAQQV